MGETDYKTLIENSRTKTEFLSALRDWWQSKSFAGYVWEVKAFAYLNPWQEEILTDYIRHGYGDGFGEQVADYYKKYISRAYRIMRLKTEYEIFELLIEFDEGGLELPNDFGGSYIEDLCSVCNEYGVFTETAKRAVERYRDLSCTYFDSTWLYWDKAKELRECITTDKFYEYLDGVNSLLDGMGWNIVDFIGFVVDVADIMQFSRFQIYWLEGYFPPDVLGDELVNKMKTYQDEQHTETATGGESTATPQPETETATGGESTGEPQTEPEPDGENLWDNFYNHSKLTEIQQKRVDKYFTRAIGHEKKYITKTPQGLRWREGRGWRAQLAWFINETLNYNGIQSIPQTAINKLFGVSRIEVEINRVSTRTNPAPWVAELKKEIFYD